MVVVALSLLSNSSSEDNYTLLTILPSPFNEQHISPSLFTQSDHESVTVKVLDEISTEISSFLERSGVVHRRNC